MNHTSDEFAGNTIPGTGLRRYAKPTLVVYGSLSDLTQRKSNKTFNEVNFSMTRRTDPMNNALGFLGDDD